MEGERESGREGRERRKEIRKVRRREGVREELWRGKRKEGVNVGITKREGVVGRRREWESEGRQIGTEGGIAGETKGGSE